MFVCAVGVEQLEADLAAGRIRLSRLRRAAGALGVRTRAAGADAARRSPAAAPAGGLPSVREDARAASGVVCAAPARRDRVMIAALLDAAAGQGIA